MIGSRCFSTTRTWALPMKSAVWIFHQAQKAFTVDGVTYGEGSFVVSLAQPKMGLIRNLLGVYSYTGKLEVVIVYVAEYLSGNLMVGDESQAVKLFDPQEIPWQDLAFESTRDALRDYCKKGAKPFGNDQT